MSYVSKNGVVWHRFRIAEDEPRWYLTECGAWFRKDITFIQDDIPTSGRLCGHFNCMYKELESLRQIGAI